MVRLTGIDIKKGRNMLTLIDDPLLDTVQAAAVIDTKPETLEVWRSTKRYNIPFIKIGRKVRYRKSALLYWLESRTQGGDYAE